MKKLLTLLAILALVATACGGDDTSAADAEAEAAARAAAEAQAAQAQAEADAAAADAAAAAEEAAAAQAALDEAMAELEATKMAADEGDEAAQAALAEAEAKAADAEAMAAEAEEAAAMAQQELDEAAMAMEEEMSLHGGTLVIAQPGDPTGLHPNRFGSTNDRNIITNMYDTLVEFDLNTYEIVPSLATDWSVSEDGLTWTFNLREGVSFHDGSPFGAEDVVTSMSRAQEPESGRTASLLTRVSETVATGDLTVEIRLSEPDRILASTLVDVYISPRDPDIDLNETPIGTGPFKFVEWERNQQVEIVRNDDFWMEGLPYLDGIIYTTVPDGTVQSLQIRTGEVDMLASTPLGDIGVLQSAGVQILGPAAGFNSGLYHFHVNTRRDPWSNPLVRKAVSMALDRQALQRSLFGFMQILSNPMEANPAFFNPDAASYNTPDLEGAKALMAEAGYPDGFDGGEMINCSLGFQFDTLAQGVQSQLQNLGIEVSLNLMDVGTYVNRTLIAFTQDPDNFGNFDLALCAMVPKPDEYDLMNHPYNKLFTETMGWIDTRPEFFELLTNARSIASDEEYTEAMHQLQMWAMEEQPQIVIGGRVTPIAAAGNVHGFIAHTQGHLFLTNVYKTDG
ncbi:MAG: ABC transporter substrate-binding protein [bacterium]|nr:ABC transporter substrate-binding protein [Acidimicrobiia bacterium]MCY4648880.1 ABC transporter substrate-binding protein [bacterium]